MQNDATPRSGLDLKYHPKSIIMMLTRKFDDYRLGSSFELDEPQLRTFINIFNQPAKANSFVLGGRTAISLREVDGIGSVAIKHYRRGGLMRYFIKRRYFKFGKTRAQREFELLDLVGNLGLNVPEPIAYAHRGRLFYRAWLVTREIHQPLSLVRLSLQDEQKARTAMESVITQISALIQNDILHVDLHPGNVVVDAAGKVYLIDFDKGSVYHGDRQKLKNHYLVRWQRAVSKHRLPEMLSDILQTGFEEIRL